MTLKTGQWIESETNQLINDFEILVKNNEIIKWKELAQKYQRKPSSLMSKLNSLGYRWHKNMKRLLDKYVINESVFEVIDTEAKAYWYGFLFADGYVKRNKNNGQISLGLCIKDKPHLEKFKQFLQTDIPIKEIMTKERDIISGNSISHIKPSMQCIIRINRTKMADDLIKKGCIPKKSLVKQFPQWLNPELYPHYIRGYFDGNGTIGAYYFGKYFRPMLGIISTKNHLNQILTILESKTIKTMIQVKKKMWNLSVTGLPNIKKMYTYLYSNASIWLDRKKDIFDECNQYNHENSEFRNHEYWTKEEENQLQNDLITKNYHSYTDLAKKYNRTIPSLKQKIYRNYKHLL